MTRLPVIVSFGGYNAAGRSSFHHAYKRLIIESLDSKARRETICNLAVLMELLKFKQGQYIDEGGQVYSADQVVLEFSDTVLASTLVRKIEKTYFDVDAVSWQQDIQLDTAAQPHFSFCLPKNKMPSVLPESWTVKTREDGLFDISINENMNMKLDSLREISAKAAGQFPTGFDPAKHYSSRFHPRSLQSTIVAASDAVNSLGIPWQSILDRVNADEISVYSSNIMGQLDDAGLGGMLTSRLKGKRISSKQCPLGHNSMTADFINAYVLGSVGSTASITGACASFLYNLKAGIEDIKSGRSRVVMVGNSETPITSEIIDGYGSMSALASKEGLKNLEGLSKDDNTEPDYRKSSRPFGKNCGFTIAESSQYFILMDDELALEMGVTIHGAVSDVFVNADGIKKSISSPGAGNYITMAKAVAAAQCMLGADSVQQRSFVMAHGSSTPQNRVSESKIFEQVAKAFEIKDWPVCAVKSYLGHSLASASCDQLMTSLGTFKYGVLPGLKTIDEVASDVHQDHLFIPLKDEKRSAQSWDCAFLNSKGFGGNNATATILSPHVVMAMLNKRHGSAAMAAYKSKQVQTEIKAGLYDEQASHGDLSVIYKFGEPMINEETIQITKDSIKFANFVKAIALPKSHLYEDMF